MISMALYGVLTGLLLFAASASAQMAVRENMADVCYQCHATVKAKLSEKFQHFPFKQGKCSSCHSSHVSSKKGLINGSITQLCNDCHQSIKKLLAGSSVHGALLSGTCTDCHDPHASSRKNLLKKDEKEICWGCHAETRKGMDKGRVHQPLKDGACSDCHNPHASSVEALLVSEPNKLCKNCHQPQCKAGGVMISGITKDKKCTSCHSGHSADAKGLLGPFGHKDFLERKCEACHLPVTAGQPMTTKKAGKELCATCHQNVSVRPNDPHLSVQTSDSCANCHESHASRSPKLLTRTKALCATCHEAVYRGIRAMEKSYQIKCVPVRDRNCFACHVPPHAAGPRYFKIADTDKLCSSCHVGQHRTSHPIGEKIIDPRTGKAMGCLTCHSLHAAKAEFMLTHDRKRQLCVQCHKGR